MREARKLRTDVVEVLRGAKKADAVLVNGKVVDVVSGRVVQGGVAVKGDLIVAVGDVERFADATTRRYDVGGRYLTPGLIDTHLHAYESNLNMTEFAKLLLRRGTTAVPEAVYGPSQVCGIEAARFFVEELRRTPMNVLLQVPVLAYLQNLELGLPAGPNSARGEDLFPVLDWEGCVGLEEPPYIPMVEKDPYILRLCEEALRRGLVIMGHGAGLKGDELAAYAAMGVSADHEAVSAEEALERIAAGMMVAMRESDVAHNQEDVQRAITEHGADPSWFMFCADVLDSVTARNVGHVDHQIRLAVRAGIDPLAALRMATLNAARYYRVDHRIGSLTPGRQADVLVVRTLEGFEVDSVFVRGRPVVWEGEFVAALERPTYPAFLRNTVRLPRRVTPEDLRVAVPADRRSATVRVIGAELLVSDERTARLPVKDGNVVSDTGQDVLKIAMFDRYGRSDRPAIGFLQGYHLKRGALGTTYNPMYHNVVVLGVDDRDMAVAANALADMGGGFVAVADGEVVGRVPLPLAGLLYDGDADEFVGRLEGLYRTVRELGCTMPAPYHNLAFTVVCGELPFLKLSHLGLFDVVKRQVLPTVVDA